MISSLTSLILKREKLISINITHLRAFPLRFDISFSGKTLF